MMLMDQKYGVQIVRKILYLAIVHINSNGGTFQWLIHSESKSHALLLLHSYLSTVITQWRGDIKNAGS